MLEFDILKSAMSRKLTGLSSIEVWDYSYTIYKTITL